MRSGSRSQAESQSDVQDSANRNECEAAGRAQVQDLAVSNRKTTEEGEQHAKRKIDEAPILHLLGFGVIAAATAASAQTARQPLFLVSATTPTSYLSKTI